MTITLADNKVFDDYALTYGWVYDNGGRYIGEHWDWYIQHMSIEGSDANLVLLRQPPDRIAIIRFKGLTPSELWRGQITTTTDFDQMIVSLGLSRVKLSLGK